MFGVLGLLLGGCGSLGVLGFTLWLKFWVGVFGLYPGYCFERLDRTTFWLTTGDKDFWDSAGLQGFDPFPLKAATLGWLGATPPWSPLTSGLMSFCQFLTSFFARLANCSLSVFFLSSLTYFPILVCWKVKKIHYDF